MQKKVEPAKNGKKPLAKAATKGDSDDSEEEAPKSKGKAAPAPVKGKV